MFNLDKYIADSVTFRPASMFKGDIGRSGDSFDPFLIKGLKYPVSNKSH